MTKRILTRIWRRWLLLLHGRWRERKARCQVCGEWFDWRAPMGGFKCPACRAKHGGRPLGWAQQREKQGK